MKPNIYLKYKLLPREQRHKTLTQFIIGIGFILLGCGNIIFGEVKKYEYEQILQQASKEIQTTKIKTKKNVFLIPEIDIDNQTRHINKINSRIDFYTITVYGGIIFLIISLTFFILASINLFLYSQTEENN